MPVSKQQVKRKTKEDKTNPKGFVLSGLSKISVKRGRLKETEPTVRGRTNDARDAPLVPLLSVGQCRSGIYTPDKNQKFIDSSLRAYSKESSVLKVPVVDINNKPLMSTTPSRARRWIKSREATPFFKGSVFCIRLNRDPSARNLQDIVVAIDPGSKKEGFTIKSEAHTYLNIQADAVTWVKKAVETRRMMRRSRRQRKTPCRVNRLNKKKGQELVPSIKARWQWKLRIIEQLAKIYPITDIVVEDIKAKSTAKNANFSPLEIGKKWFYEQLKRFGSVHLKEGWETKQLRDNAGLSKTKDKLSNVFEAHCVDSWVLANWLVGGHIKPDNKQILFISPIQFHRRQLHALQPVKNGIRRNYGGTRSTGLKRGSLAKHKKHGLCYVGGADKLGISLHSITDGKRLCQNAKLEGVRFRAFNIWRAHFSLA